jgi:hypothetical protein
VTCGGSSAVSSAKKLGFAYFLTATFGAQTLYPCLDARTSLAAIADRLLPDSSASSKSADMAAQSAFRAAALATLVTRALYACHACAGASARMALAPAAEPG